MKRLKPYLRLMILFSMLLSLVGSPGFVTPAQAAVTTFGAGSLIIPMDTSANGQNYGMLRAYGLVYDLLKHNVPVYWIINPAKPANGDDFSVATANSLQDVRTGALFGPRSYRGGPFIVDSSDAAAALPIIQAWQATVGDQTAVHRLVSGTVNPDVYRILVRAPRIAILKDGNETIAFNNLNAAGIPDALGAAWSSTSPDALSETDIQGPTTTNDSDGALFIQPGGLPRYCFLASMHYYTTSHTDEVVQETRSWLTGQPDSAAFMQCEAARVFENAVGGLFLTNAGLDDDGAATTNPIIRVPGNGLTQIDGAFDVDSGAVDSMKANPGGYKAGATTLINDGASTLLERITLLTGRLDGNAGNGRLTYLAGHDYSLDLPITSNPQTNGVRIFLNAILMADCAANVGQPDATFTLSAPALISANEIQYTLDYSNPGPRPAEYFRIRDPIPTNTTYVLGSASITPNSTSGGVLTWNLPPLGAGQSGSLTFRVSVTTDGTYQNTAQLGFSHLPVRNISSNTVVTVRDTISGSGILDDFNRANGSVGANWWNATALSRYRILGNQLDVQMGGGLVWRPTAFDVNQEAFVTLSLIDPRSRSQGLMLKVQTGRVPRAGSILATYDARNQALRVSAWRHSIQTNYSPIPAAFVDGDKLHAQVFSDGTVALYRNGALIGTVTLSAADQAFFNSRGGKIGIWTQYASNALLDDFGGGTIIP